MKQRAPRRSADQWKDIIQAQAVSGKTIRAFCAENDVGLACFGKWKNRLNTNNNSTLTAQPDFQPVHLVEPSETSNAHTQAAKVTLSIGAVTLTIVHGTDLQ